jgi:hypothetical protein
MASGGAAVSTRLDTHAAGQVAPAGRALPKEIVRLRAKDMGPGVPRTAQLQGVTDGAAIRQLFIHVCPHADVEVRLAVADEEHAVFCSAQEDVYAVLGAEEPNLLCCVAADERDNDDFCLLALKVIDCGESDGFDECLLL